MTNTTGCANAAFRQRGVSLIEAMVSTLLLSILFLGVAFVLSRGLVSQRYMNTQNLALLEIRESLQQTAGGATGFCNSPPALTWLGAVALEKGSDCKVTKVPLSIGGIDVEVDAQSIQVFTTSNPTSQGLFGGDGRIRVSDN